jgi:hypothetical protein
MCAGSVCAIRLASITKLIGTCVHSHAHPLSLTQTDRHRHRHTDTDRRTQTQTLTQTLTRTHVRRYALVRAVRTTSSVFRGYDQHDAEEFLKFLLERLDRELELPDAPPSGGQGDGRLDASASGHADDNSSSGGGGGPADALDDLATCGGAAQPP